MILRHLRINPGKRSKNPSPRTFPRGEDRLRSGWPEFCIAGSEEDRCKHMSWATAVLLERCPWSLRPGRTCESESLSTKAWRCPSAWPGRRSRVDGPTRTSKSDQEQREAWRRSRSVIELRRQQASFRHRSATHGRRYDSVGTDAADQDGARRFSFFAAAKNIDIRLKGLEEASSVQISRSAGCML